MTGAALLTLVATVLTAEGMAVEIDLGTEAGIRVGDRGVIFYEVGEGGGGGELVSFEVGQGEVLDAGRFTAWLLVDPEAEILPGYSARLEIPAERLTRQPAPAPPELPAGSPASRGRFAVSDRVTPCLSLRPLPSLDTARLDCLPPRTAVNGLRSLGPWMKVRLDDGREGWMMERFLGAGAGGRPQATAAAAPHRQTEQRSLAQPEALETPVAGPGAAEQARLRRELAELRSSLAASESQRRELGRRLTEAERQRDLLLRQAADLEPARSAQGDDRAAELGDLLVREEALADDLRRQLTAARAGLETEAGARRDLAAQLEAVAVERGALGQRVADLEGARGELAAELEAAHAELSELRQEGGASLGLEARLGESEAARVEGQRRLELAQRALAASQEVEKRLDRRLDDLLLDLERTRGELEQARASGRDLVTSLEQERATVADLKARLAELEGVVESTRVARAEAEGQLESSQAAQAELESRLAAAQAAARERLEALQSEAAAQVAAVTAERDVLREEQTVLGGQLSGLEGELGIARSEVARLREADEAAVRSAEALQASLEEASGERDAWRERAESAEASGGSLAAELEVAESRATELSRRLALAPAELGVGRFLVGPRARPCLRVRAEPSAEAVAMGCLEPGTGLEVVDLVPDWKRVRPEEGVEGWVAAGYLASERDLRLAELEADLEATRAARAEAESRLEAVRAEGEGRLEAAESRATELSRRLALAPAELGVGRFLVGDRARPCLRVRAEPSAEAVATGCLEPGIGLEVVDLVPDWKRVRSEEGVEGWVAAGYLASERDLRLAELEADLEATRAAQAEAESRLEAARAEAESRLEAAQARLEEARQEAAAGTVDLEAQLAAERGRASDLEARLDEARDRLAREPSQGPAEPAAPDAEADLRELAGRWAAAWSQQDVVRYLAFYSRRFRPPGEMSREDWQAQKRRRLSQPDFIVVELSSVEARAASPDRAWVRFVQRYRSDSDSDTVTKRLELVREDGAWKILRERLEPSDDPE